MKGTAIAFLLAGLAALVATVFVVRATQPRIDQAWASAGWPTTEGTVVEMTTGQQTGTHVRYRYAVAGREYEGERVRFVEKAWADNRKQVADRYPEGKRVTVAYDPARPESAVLEPGTSWPAVLKKHVGAAIFALLGLGLAYVGVSGLRG